MGIPVNMGDLIDGNVVESTRIEFKESFNPNPIVHTICAFANDIDNIGGGYIIIGIGENNGRPELPPKGIEADEVDAILKRLIEICRYIEPLYNPITEPRMFQERHIVVIWVPGGHGRPYKASKDVFGNQSYKRYYIRKSNSTIVASSEEEKELFYASMDIPFDDRPNLAASPNDLSSGLMREHLREIGSSLYTQSAGRDPLELANDLQLLSGPPEDLHPRNVGLLMFSDRVNEFFRYARIEVVDIPHPTGDGMTERIFTGPIQRQLRDALAYIRNYAIASLVEKTDEDAEANVTFNYPYPAVEEILSNAVYHRSYQVNEPTTVTIRPSSMEITSYPGFDRSITDEAIARHEILSRIYRNRRIGDFLKELHLIEGRNTGFPTAFEALRRNGSALPVFDMDEMRGYLSVTIPIHPAFAGNGASDRTRDYEQAIIEAVEATPLSLTELAHALGYRGISKKLSTTVDSLLQRGNLTRVPGEGSRTKLARPR